MTTRNPLNEGGQPQEPLSPEKIAANLHSVSSVKFRDQNGNTREITIGTHHSRPGPNGEYIEQEEEIVDVDRFGNPMPENPRDFIPSHTGLYIGSPEQRAICSSIFHPQNRSRNILIAQDGTILPNGQARCSNCQQICNTIYVALGIMVLACVIGLYKAVGFF